MPVINSAQSIGGANHSHSNLPILDGISVVNGVIFYHNFNPNPAELSGLIYWFEARFLTGYTENKRVPSLVNNVGLVI
jgi:hypothetical protein